MQAEIRYDKIPIKGGVDLALFQFTNGVNVNYGDYTRLNGTGANVERSRVNFQISYENISQKVNSDNSITFSADVVLGDFYRTDTGPDDYNRNVTVYASLNDEVVWRFVEPVIHASHHAGVTRRITVNIPPLQEVRNFSLYFLNDIEGSDKDDELYIGMFVRNPNPPRYIPMKGKKGGAYKSLNDHMLEGKKANTYHTIWNYFGDNNRSNGHGKKSNNQIRLEKD